MPANGTHRLHAEGVFIHVYNKGVANRAIFSDQQDFDTFLDYLRQYLSPIEDQNSSKMSFTVRGRTYEGVPHLPKNYYKKIELIAYSLKPNHFHLLLQQKTPGTVEKFIRSLCTRYAIYFNKKHHASGAIFQGPYKSIGISNIDEVLHLTRYFHLGDASEAHVSSYEVFLGTKEATWVKCDTIITHFENTDNEFFKGRAGYRNFVEKYQPTLNDSKLLEKIALEDKSDHLARISEDDYTSEKTGEVDKGTFKSVPHHQRFPEIGAAFAVFLLLFGLGFNNIKSTAAKSVVVHQFPNSMVSGVTDEVPENSPTPTPITEKFNLEKINLENIVKTIIQSPKASGSANAINPVDSVQSPTPTAIVELTQINDVPSEKTLRIKIADGSQSVNVRKSPSLLSEIVKETFDGDEYYYLSMESGWYKIKLEDGTTGYVSSKYSELKN